MNTVTIKVGQFPGEIKEYVVERGTTVSELLKIANITTTAEQSITADGNTVDLNAAVDNFSLVLATKRLKGAHAA